MPKVTYIEFNGSEHVIDVAEGENVMRGAVYNGVEGITGECGGGQQFPFLDRLRKGFAAHLIPRQHHTRGATQMQLRERRRCKIRLALPCAFRQWNQHDPIAIAGNEGAALFAHANVSVLLDVGPEVISGSTRMGAGTAQKAALNMLSTLVGVRLGHVHDNHMVNLNADNLKLRKRAERMVAAIAGVSVDTAASALEQTGGSVKPAILVAAGSRASDAPGLLAAHGGVVRAALAAMKR